ncbi:hypothetical protein FBUS_10893 [Fasciolopsis buskii]|uniref:Uncharacterized protein n=1 Tax=Fasciolopsis buskii TaxID=27845 RepID=A0A8E0RXB5_9TREM|nr:hypothetical protein FBUS_10893 [Fasciolopsis buski]
MNDHVWAPRIHLQLKNVFDVDFEVLLFQPLLNSDFHAFSAMKYSRRSSIIVNAIPVYHKEANILAYAADKAIVLCYLNENRVVNLKAHDDTVTVLQFHPTKPHTVSIRNYKCI